MKAWIQRWRFRFSRFWDSGKDLNHRTTVQVYLYDCATALRLSAELYIGVENEQ